MGKNRKKLDKSNFFLQQKFLPMCMDIMYFGKTCIFFYYCTSYNAQYYILGVPKFRTAPIFVTDIQKYSFFLIISSDKTSSSEKNDIKIIEIALVVLIIFVISQNIVIVNFLFILVTLSVKDYGFSDFHTLLPGSPLIRANKTKRELMDSYTRRI